MSSCWCSSCICCWVSGGCETWIVVCASILGTASYGTDTDTNEDTVDSDGNGIQDRYEADLVAKFVPAMVLDSRDNVSPEPISFIGAESTAGLWVKAYDLESRKVFDKRLIDITPGQWNPPLTGRVIDDGVIIKSNGNFQA